ncbi:MAG: hypothetical protein PUC06_00850 [Oscillospiraceae bacterium]|nr:hypothetical protein [Oscillospiraceae bacterium]
MNDKKHSFLNSKLPKGNGTHASLVCIVGAYILYMGYRMIQNTKTGHSEMSMTMTLVLASIMALVGLVVVAYGILIWYGIWKRSDLSDSPIVPKKEDMNAPEEIDQEENAE